MGRFGHLLGCSFLDRPKRKLPGHTERGVSPLVTVVTVSYNSLAGLRRTNQSLADCRARGWQTVVVDGLSQDGTREFLRSPDCVYETIVEERDSGIFDAMNKGIKVAQGQYLLFMNCGDRLFEGLDLAWVEGCLNSALGVHLGFLLVDTGFIATVSRDSFHPQTFLKHSFPHQSAFIPKAYFSRWGVYDESFQLYGDQEWFLRAMCGGAAFLTLDSVVARYEGGGRSEDRKNQRVLETERQKALVEHLGRPLYNVLATASRFGWDELWIRFAGKLRRAKFILAGVAQ